MNGTAIVFWYQWGNPGLITLPIKARMSIETSTADGKGKDKEWGVCVWPSTHWRAEKQILLLPNRDSPSPWFWSDLGNNHSPTAYWKQEVQWSELLLCALKPKNIYFRNNTASSDLLLYPLGQVLGSGALSKAVHCFGFGILCLPISGSPWFIACQFTLIHPCSCQDGAWAKNTVKQKVPHA